MGAGESRPKRTPDKLRRSVAVGVERGSRGAREGCRGAVVGAPGVPVPREHVMERMAKSAEGALGPR